MDTGRANVRLAFQHQALTDSLTAKSMTPSSCYIRLVHSMTHSGKSNNEAGRFPGWHCHTEDSPETAFIDDGTNSHPQIGSCVLGAHETNGSQA
jgi:hypothetical protein